MSESPSLCFCSSTLSHLPFSSGSVETALFRLSLTGFATNLLFSSLATSSPPYFSVSVTHTRTRLTGQQQQQNEGLSSSLWCAQLLKKMTKSLFMSLLLLHPLSVQSCSAHQYDCWYYFCMAAGSKLLFIQSYAPLVSKLPMTAQLNGGIHSEVN